jgi:hypothetical protein
MLCRVDVEQRSAATRRPRARTQAGTGAPHVARLPSFQVSYYTKIVVEPHVHDHVRSANENNMKLENSTRTSYIDLGKLQRCGNNVSVLQTAFNKTPN